MKKFLPFLLILLSTAACLTGCDNKSKSGGNHCSGPTCTVGRKI